MSQLHPTIQHLEMPRRIRALPLTESGYPVLYFADTVDGKPDLRVMDGRKLVKCINSKLCWLCGQPLGRNMAFVIGPMCCVTRTTSEPPCHYECAQYAVKACPFLTRPRAHRREGDLEGVTMAGHGLKRNPGVAAIWVTRSYKPWKPGGGGVLITVGDPQNVEWWAEGRQATYSEVAESIESGAPELMKQNYLDDDPDDSLLYLSRQFASLLPWFRDLPGREARKPEHSGMNEAVLIAARAAEVAWFATNPAEAEYIRPALPGEYPPDLKPSHVRVRKLDPAANLRSREFGIVAGGEFVAKAAEL